MKRLIRYMFGSAIVLVLFVIGVSAYAKTPTTEWVNFYSQNSTVAGKPLPIGSTVQAYDPGGVLCGQFEVHTSGEYGLLPCYRDDPSTPEDEGAEPGDLITFRVDGNKAATSQQPVWTEHGDVFEINLTVTSTKTKKKRAPACFRINFDGSDEQAHEGVYEVRELGGRLLYTWFAKEGWRDSGWVYGTDISFENVYIEILKITDYRQPEKLVIFNPAPGTHYGWLSQGMCHAIEVGWPDETITPKPTPDAFDGFNDEFDLEELDKARFIWPDIQPTPPSTSSSSLHD